MSEDTKDIKEKKPKVAPKKAVAKSEVEAKPAAKTAAKPKTAAKKATTKKTSGQKTSGKIKVTLTKSGIGYPQRQKDTLRGLGLRKMHSSKILNDTPAIRGMAKKVEHLVKLEVV
ncbi:MAG: 50S ribosomal protein L30 [Deltaproteobacteria bacterium]|nr:50S ribosomal protein L30 [Deltaproteobacteria bacterium]